MRFGQDERAFKAYAMYASTWKVDGIHAERDKNDGPGNMLSAFQSYIFGYGMAITDNLHQRVNELRNGEEYAAVSELNEDDTAKQSILGSFQIWQGEEWLLGLSAHDMPARRL